MADGTGHAPRAGCPLVTVAAPKAAGTQRFEALDALRGLCAVLVCLFHFPALGIAQSGFVRSSWVFVDFFFVLSGFVMMHSYGGRLAGGMKIGNFMGTRFWRLYPLHLVVLLAFLCCELIGKYCFPGVMLRESFEGTNSPQSFVLSLLFLQSFGITHGLSWNHPSWSIAVEFWTYALFAIAVLVAGAYLRITMLVAAAISLAALFFVTDRGINVTWDFGMIRCVYGFALGVLSYMFWHSHGALLDRLGFAGRTLVELVLLLVVVFSVLHLSVGRISLLLPPLFVLVVLGLSGNGGLIAAMLKTRVLLFMGTISYSIYMLHILVQARLEDLIRMFTGTTMMTDKYLGTSALSGNLITLLMLAILIIASSLCYRLIEKPGIAYGKRLFAARRPAVTN